ncbi:DNA-directed RNA polymerase II subunit Rpb4-like [Schistocerca americana]|uniref:DNA-directed RNA polymerase II subunit Rpb4-like n=1 Tax=Schistocerca americana TaxID=7009 RepID=UPI001F4F8C5D|nr:DNA-directed RNA polymerase II subunit Rpb4-like [Schistocerca americana]
MASPALRDMVEEDTAALVFSRVREGKNAVDQRGAHAARAPESAEEEQEFSEVFVKTLSYTNRFRKFKNKDTTATVRNLLAQKKLLKFELASLANLRPENPEEAKSLITSLEG